MCRLPLWLPLLLCLAAHPAMAYYGLFQRVQVFAANSGDPAFFYSEVPSDFISADDFDSGPRTSELDPPCAEYRDVWPWDCIRDYPIGTGRAASGADLAAGRLQVAGNAGGYLSLASSSVTMADALTFNLPEGVEQATVGFSMTVSGQATPPNPPPNGSCRTDGYSSVNLNGVTADSFANPGCGESFIGRTISGQAIVADGILVPFQATLSAFTYATLDEGASYDLSSNGRGAYVTLSLPEGVTFTSESGVFLLPEPESDWIPVALAAGLLGMEARRGRSRRGFVLDR